MTDAEFWTRVSDRLVLRRREKGLKSANAVASIAGAPTQKTVEQIESGNFGRIDKLAEYAEAVDLSLVDLFRAALGDVRDTTPELEEIIRKYYVTTADGRLAIHATARAVPVRAPDGGTPIGPQGSQTDTPKSTSATPKRRVLK